MGKPTITKSRTKRPKVCMVCNDLLPRKSYVWRIDISEHECRFVCVYPQRDCLKLARVQIALESEG